MDKRDLRSSPRFDSRVPVDCKHNGETFSGTTRNLSLGGLYIETDRKMAIGDTVSLKFSVPTQKEPIEVNAVVRWVEAAQGIGVHFQGLRAKDAYALGKLSEVK